jgi:hypothetical protein
MGKSSAPPAPDYTGAAQATASGNLQAAQQATEANRVNTYTPYGSLTYSQDASNPNKWSSNVNLSDTGKQLLDQQNKTSLGLGNLQDAATARVGASLGSPMPSAYDPTKATNNAADLINARLLPQQQRDHADLDTQLANQGIMPGSEAYQRAQDQLGRTQNDARSQAQLQGITLGQSQQGQQYAQETANRNIPMNELNAIRTGAQVTNPTFQNAPQQATTSGPDMLGAAGMQNQYNMGLYGSQVGQQNALLGTAGQLGSAALMFSDARLKSDIRRIGTHDSLGIGIYSYEKFGAPEIGVLAHELEAVMPGAVSTHESGFKVIDMGAL